MALLPTSTQLSAAKLAELSDEVLRHNLDHFASSSDTLVSNWAGAFASRPRRVFEPETYEQCALVFEYARREQERVRVIGVVHSPSDLALTTGLMIRTLKLNRLLDVSSISIFVHHHLSQHRLLSGDPLPQNGDDVLS
jgi:FAD/FMN-containing dehydrogenase